VWAWGKNDDNELGLGKSSRGTGRPVRVPGITSAVAVAAFGNTSYALLRDGSVLGWGEHLWKIEARGERNRDVRSASPVRVPGVADAVAVRAGSPSLALLRDGTVMSWGGGYLGDGSPKVTTWSEVPPQPVHVSGMIDAVAIAAGPDGSGVVRRDGSVWVWGDGDPNPLGLGKGTLADGATGDRASPVRVIALSRAVDLAVATASTVALSDGTVRSWGDERLGATGRPGVERLVVPTAIPGVNDIVRVWAAHYSNLALTRDGRIRAWGSVALPQ
jgi:alpha-tubulin suppressor-like RCC1 family protein